MKRIKKLIAAEKIALEIGVEIDDDIYKNLKERNYIWDRPSGSWIDMNIPTVPTQVIELRLTGDVETIKQDCHDIITLLKLWFFLEKRSRVYRSRPPKQNEARIYLTLRRR